MRVALIDHYDSFTFNVIDWLTAGEPDVEVVYATHDDAPALARIAAERLPLVLSPGPRRPEDAPGTLALAQELLGKAPILGICLGHQLLAHLAGGRIVRSAAPFHGTTRRIEVQGPGGLLAGCAPGFRAAVYHSLVVEAGTLPPDWRVTAVDELGEIQGLAWEPPGRAPAYGLQFHPDSYMSEKAQEIRRAWLALV